MTHRSDLSDLSGPAPGHPWHRRLRVPLAAAAALVAAGTVFAVIPSAAAAVPFAVESLDGSGNNVNNPTFGQSNRAYARVGTAHYADGISTLVSGNAPHRNSIEKAGERSNSHSIEAFNGGGRLAAIPRKAMMSGRVR